MTLEEMLTQNMDRWLGWCGHLDTSITERTRPHITTDCETLAELLAPHFEAFGRAVHRKTRENWGYFDMTGGEEVAIAAGVEALRVLVGD